jgi:hypothetical protein
VIGETLVALWLDPSHSRHGKRIPQV